MELKVIGRQGDQPMPITDKTVGRKHAFLRTLPDGNFELESIGEHHPFYVNGMEFRKKRVSKDTLVRFGNFSATIGQLLTPVQAPPPPPAGNGPQGAGARAGAGQQQAPQVPDVSAEFDKLENVWKKYNEDRRKLGLAVTKLNNLRMVVLPLGSLIGIGASMVSTDNNAMRLVGSVIGVMFSVGISLIIGQLSMKRQKRVQEETEELTADFMLTYVCPNEKNCNRFLGHTPFKVLKAQGRCPYCKAKFK